MERLVSVSVFLFAMDHPPRSPKRLALRRVAKLLLLSCLGLYALVCVLMAIFQHSFLYFPVVLNRPQVDQKAQAAVLERWTNSSGEFIGMKRLSSRQPAEGSILITYGNGSTATGCAHYATDIQSVAALDVFILEYPGYEDRPGRPTQRSIFNAATEAFLTISSKKPVYLVGESLGTGVASYLAGTYSNQIAGVVLLSPFNCLAAAAQSHFPMLPVRLLLVDRYRSENYLCDYHGPVGIMVDGEDTIVPAELGYRLHEAYAGPKKLWVFPKGWHCQIAERPSIFWNEVIEFWQTNRPPENLGF